MESGVRKSAAGGYSRSLISSALSNSLSFSFFGLSGHGWGSFLLWNPLVKRAGSRHRNGFKRLSWAAVASYRNGSFRWLDSCRGMWQVAGLCLLLCLFIFFFSPPPLLFFSLFFPWARMNEAFNPFSLVCIVGTSWWLCVVCVEWPYMCNVPC